MSASLTAEAVDECEALRSIYGENHVSLHVGSLSVLLQEHGCVLRFALGQGYPAAPPRVQASVRGDERRAAQLQAGLESLLLAAPPGEVVVFTCVEWARDQLQSPQPLPELLEEAASVEPPQSLPAPRTEARAGASLAAFDTIACEATSQLTEKKSRFLAYACHASDRRAADVFLALRRDDDATHNCWAYCCGQDARSSDDGEPGGTAGAPILRAIEHSGLDCVVVLVVRHFGGILLGSGGLTRAYGTVAAAALRAAARRRVVPSLLVTASFALGDDGAVRAVLAGAERVCDDYDEAADRYVLSVRVPADTLGGMRAALADATSGRVILSSSCN